MIPRLVEAHFMALTPSCISKRRSVAVRLSLIGPINCLVRLLAACLVVAPAGAQTFTTFQVGAASTAPTSINGSGTTAGVYIDQNSVYQGFLRFPDGSITLLKVPGCTSTTPYGSNASRTVVGICGVGSANHGFVCATKANCTVFDVPGAIGSTIPLAINNSGTVAGWCEDTQGVIHAFERTADGTITSFDGPGPGTMASAINSEGVIVGSTGNLGFRRSPEGTLTTFRAPGQTFATSPMGVNSSGELAGTYRNWHTGRTYGFVRSNGVFTSFDIPASVVVFVPAINDSGTVTGGYRDASNMIHGFIRDAAGNITSFDVPGGANTNARAINRLGWITGAYLDQTSSVYKGFILKP